MLGARRLQRGLVAAAVAVAVLASSNAGANAGVSAGPRLATVSLTDSESSARGDSGQIPEVALQSLGVSGEQRRVLLGGPLEAKRQVVPMPFDGPHWSADGSLLTFAGGTGKKSQVYVLSADGGGLRAVPGTKGGRGPIVSPDGRTIAFSRGRFRFHLDPDHPQRTHFYTSTTAWIADLGGANPRRLTRWRDGLSNEPTSFTADSSSLLLTKRDEKLKGPRVVLAGLDGGSFSDLAQLAQEAAVSPDGSRIAFIGFRDGDVVQAEEDRDFIVGELYVMDIDGSHLRRLTHSDDVRESAPSWDPSGNRIAYVRATADTGFASGLGELFPFGNSIEQVNVDGSCRREVVSIPGIAFYGAAWQPGPGREVRPISC